jgi:hypothetical protein
MRTLKNRIQKLETLSSDRLEVVIVTWRASENHEEAIRRHCAENPQHRSARRFVILETNLPDDL